MNYSKAVHELGLEIGRKLAASMGFEDDDLFKGWACQFRINKYHFAPESVGSAGVQIHTDSSFLTILQDDDNVGGLQVMNKISGEYIPVDPSPNTLLVNLGDIATVWSNGRFCNVKHRVECTEASVRISIAMFVLGPKEERVEAPEKLVDDQHPRVYVPITFEEYRNLRISTGFRAGEALSLLHTAAQFPYQNQ
jgi:isopenicillin N synthase-like dioxygenase